MKQKPLGSAIRLSNTTLRKRIRALPQGSISGGVMGFPHSEFYEAAFGFSETEFERFLNARQKRGAKSTLDNIVTPDRYEELFPKTGLPTFYQLRKKMTPRIYRELERTAAQMQRAGYQSCFGKREVDENVIDKKELLYDMEDRIIKDVHYYAYMNESHRAKAEYQANFVKRMRELRANPEERMIRNKSTDDTKAFNDIYRNSRSIAKMIGNIGFFQKDYQVAKQFEKAWQANTTEKVPTFVYDDTIFGVIFDSDKFTNHVKDLVVKRKMTEKQYNLLSELGEVAQRCDRTPFWIFRDDGQRYAHEIIGGYETPKDCSKQFFFLFV